MYAIVYSETRFSYGDLYSGLEVSIKGVCVCVCVCVCGGGGGVGFATTEWRSFTSVFLRSPLDQKEAIGVAFRSMHPLGRFSSCAELRRPIYSGFYSTALTVLVYLRNEELVK